MSTHAPAHKALAAAHAAAAPKPNTAFENTALHLKSTTAAHAASSGSGGSILRTVIGLAIVIAVIWGLTWVVRRMKGKDMPKGGSDAGLEHVAAIPLGQNKSVALVRVGSELHLIGVAEHAVTGIRTFTEDEAIEAGLPVTPPGTNLTYTDETARSGGGFIHNLKRMTQR